MPTLAKALLQGLKDHGARELFGIPGDFVLPFFKVIETARILPHYTLSHEPGGRLRGRCGGALPQRPRRCRGHLRRRRLQYRQRRRRRLCRAFAGRGDRRRAGRARARERLPAASSGAQHRYPARGVARDHLRSGGARRRGDRAADIARVLRNARERSLPVYLELPRDMVDAKTGKVPVLPRRRPIRTRSPNARRRSSRSSRRRARRSSSSTSRSAATASRIGSPSSRASSGFRWSRPSWGAACSKTRRTS